MGNGAAANGADGSDMEDEGQSTGSRMPSGQALALTVKGPAVCALSHVNVSAV